MCPGCEPWEKVTNTHHTQCANTYRYTVAARKFVKAGRVSLTLVARTVLLVAEVEDFKVVEFNIVADKDIGEVFQERGFANTSLSNQENGVLRLKHVLRCLDDSSLE